MSERDRPFDELAAAIEADCSSQTFFVDLVSRLHAVLSADAAAAWVLQPDGSLQLAAHANYAVVSGLDSEVQQQLARVRQLACGLQASLALPPGRKWVAPGVDGPTNSSPYTLLVTSIPFAERACGALEVLVHGERTPEAVLDDLRLLMRAAGVASRYAILRQFRAFAGREEVWRKLDEFLRAVHSGSSLKEASFLLANDGKRLLGCDRVMAILKRRRRWKIDAVSDRIDAEGHSNLAAAAERLAECVALHGAPLVYDGTAPAHAPADLAARLADYLKESPSRLLVAMPLADPRTGAGRKFPTSAVLLVENVAEAAPPAEFAGRLEVLGKHAAVAIYQSLDRERVFLYGFWRWVGEWLVWPTASRRRLAATVGSAVLAVVLAFAFVPAPMWLEASGELVPKDRRSLFAPTPGIVADVRVDHRSPVQVGARVLTLDNPQLDRERLGLVGELEAKRVTRANLMGAPREQGKAERDGERAAFRIQELDGEIELLRGKLAVVDRELASLQLSAPIAGEVLTWNPKERLTGKPVNQGQELVEIADVAGAWIVEIELAENVVPHVRRAIEKRGADGVPTAFLISSAPGAWRTGRLVQLNLQGEAKENDNVFRGRVTLDEPLPAELRLAHAEIRCRIDCGSHALGHVLFWRVLDWVRGKLLW